MSSSGAVLPFFRLDELLLSKRWKVCWYKEGRWLAALQALHSEPPRGLCRPAISTLNESKYSNTCLEVFLNEAEERASRSLST